MSALPAPAAAGGLELSRHLRAAARTLGYLALGLANGVVYLLLVGGGGLVLLFALWWMYFLKEAGAGLARRRELGFWWGYGHFGIFAALAALGAGLEVAVDRRRSESTRT